MHSLLPLFLLFASSAAFLFHPDFDYFVANPSNASSRRFLVETPPRTPSERGVPHPKTPTELQERFKEDMVGILEYRSRAHYDDLDFYIKEDAQIHSCFRPGRPLKKWQFQKMLEYMSSFYQHLNNVTMTKVSEQDDYVHGLFYYHATGAHGEVTFGRFSYKASMDWDRKKMMIYYILFAGNCDDIPRTPPSDPTEEVDHYIERVRVKLQSGLFLPDGAPQKLQDFEVFGDFIAEDAHFVVCDEPHMNKKEFITYMSQRYHGIRKYKNQTFSTVKSETSFEMTFSTVWIADNTSEYRDTYQFRVKKMEDYYPVISKNFFLWKIYWVTKKCTQNVTPEMLLLSGSTQIAEVNKRFTDMIDGQNWDVFQSFMDLFDAPHAVWGSCIGSKSQTLDKIRPYMTDVSMRYATAMVSAVHIRNLTNVDFSATYLVSRANEVQEQEELDVGFAGYYDGKARLWRMTRMYFECDESS